MKKTLITLIFFSTCFLKTLAQQAGIVSPVGHANNINTIRFSSDSKRIVTSSNDKSARVWDAETGKLIDSLVGHKHYVFFAEFSTDNKYILTLSDDNAVKIWNATDNKLLHTFSNDNLKFLRSACISPDNKKVIITYDRMTEVLDLSSGKRLYKLKIPDTYFYQARFNPDGKKISALKLDGSAAFWKSSNGKLISVLKDDNNENILGNKSVWSYNTHYSKEGKTLVSTSGDLNVGIWDATALKLKYSLRPFKVDDKVINAQISNSGRFVLVLGTGKSAALIDANSGSTLYYLNHEAGLVGGSFSTDEAKVLTISRDTTVRVWESITGKLLFTISGHTAGINDARFSPDGNRIVTISDDQTVKFWDSKTGSLLFVINGNLREINAALDY